MKDLETLLQRPIFLAARRYIDRWNPVEPMGAARPWKWVETTKLPGSTTIVLGDSLTMAEQDLLLEAGVPVIIASVRLAALP